VLLDYVRVLQENARFRAQFKPVKMKELGALAYVVFDCKKKCVQHAKSLPQLHSKGMCLLAQLIPKWSLTFLIYAQIIHSRSFIHPLYAGIVAIVAYINVQQHVNK